MERERAKAEKRITASLDLLFPSPPSASLSLSFPLSLFHVSIPFPNKKIHFLIHLGKVVVDLRRGQNPKGPVPSRADDGDLDVVARDLALEALFQS